jgi:hypothetical protein
VVLNVPVVLPFAQAAGLLLTLAGIPWYQNGRGILGSKVRTKRAADLLIRREAPGTEGVERILRINTLFRADARRYSVYMEALISGAGVVFLTIDREA